MDLEGWAAAGLYDPAASNAAERRDLLVFLASEGCSVEEMQIANSRGRLFALAGDRRIRPLVGLLSLRDAAARLEVEPSVLTRVWRTLGLPDNGIDAPLLTEADVEALGTYLDVRTFLGEDVALAVSRVLGSALARITEAESSAMRVGMQGVIDVGVTGDEVMTAKAYATVTRLVPRIGQMLDTLHRQHLEATRVHFEDIDRELTERTAFRCGVGFVDLSGFTRLSQQLPLGSLSEVLSVFEETATDTIHARGGRVVKFLGDAVMWVSAAPDDLARIALDLVTHPRAAAGGIDVRAGLAYGPLLAQDGDYFGTPVNLAARLVAIAEPGQVLLAGELVDAVSTDFFVVPGIPHLLRGFEEPVTPYTLSGA
ncbi:MAG: adenylate cyclase [Frankiales bacterium]|nr:adenylate cyclase [Frankiales bacterium]